MGSLHCKGWSSNPKSHSSCHKINQVNKNPITNHKLDAVLSDFLKNYPAANTLKE